MTVSCAFTVQGNANPARHTVAYGATVNLALTAPSLASGIRTIQWSIPGTSKSTQSIPTVTPAGAPLGATASFAMPTDPGDLLGRAFRVRCLVQDAQGRTAQQHAIVGAINGRGYLPLTLDELGPTEDLATDGERHGTHGYTDELNRILSASGTSVVGAPSLHTTEHSPVGLWQFNETLADTSGNGFDLSAFAGNTRYVEIVPGLRGLKVLSTNKFRQAATGTALAIAGDITIEMLLLLDSFADGGIVSYDTGSEIQSGNVQYAIALFASDLQWFHENGAGVDRVYSPNRIPPMFELCHLAARRQSGVVQFFVNGRPFGAASSALPAPDGGTTSRLYLGFEANTTASYSIASLKVIPSALIDAHIAAEHNRTLGRWHGYV